MKKNMKDFAEKSLKSFLKKKKIGYTASLLISFLISGGIGLASSYEIASRAAQTQESLLANIEAQKDEIKILLEENEKMLKELKLNSDELIRKGDFYSKPIYPSTQIFFTYRYNNDGKGKNNTRSEWVNTLEQIKHKAGGGEVPKGKNPYAAGELLAGYTESLEEVPEKYLDKTINGDMDSFESPFSDSDAMSLLTQGNGVYVNQAPWSTVLELGAAIKPLDPELPIINKDINLSVGSPQLTNIPNPTLPTISTPIAHAGVTAPSVNVSVPAAMGAISVASPTGPSINVPDDRTISHPTVATPTVIEPTMLVAPEAPTVAAVALPSLPTINFVSMSNGNGIYREIDVVPGTGGTSGRIQNGIMTNITVVNGAFNIKREQVLGGGTSGTSAYGTAVSTANNSYSYNYTGYVAYAPGALSAQDGLYPSGAAVLYNVGNTTADKYAVSYANSYADSAAVQRIVGEVGGAGAVTFNNGKFTIARQSSSASVYLGEFLHMDIHGSSTVALVRSTIVNGLTQITTAGATTTGTSNILAAYDDVTNNYAMYGNIIAWLNTNDIILEGGNLSVTNQYYHTSSSTISGISINTGNITIRPYQKSGNLYDSYNSVFVVSSEQQGNKGQFVLYNGGKIETSTQQTGAYTINSGWYDRSPGAGYMTQSSNNYIVNKGTIEMLGKNSIGVYGQFLSWYKSGSDRGVLEMDFMDNTIRKPIQLFGDESIGLYIMPEFNAQSISGNFHVDIGASGVGNQSISVAAANTNGGEAISNYFGGNSNTSVIEGSVGILSYKDINLTSHGIVIYDKTEKNIGVAPRTAPLTLWISTAGGQTSSWSIAATTSNISLGTGSIQLIGGSGNVGIYASEGNVTSSGSIDLNGGIGNIAAYSDSGRSITVADITTTNSVTNTVVLYADGGSINVTNDVKMAGLAVTGAISSNTNNIVGAYTTGTGSITFSGATIGTQGAANIDITGQDLGGNQYRGIGLMANGGTITATNPIYIQVRDGSAGVASIGSTGSVSLQGSTIDVSSGYAAYSSGGGTINLTNANIYLYGTATAFDVVMGGTNPITTTGGTIEVRSNDVIVFNLTGTIPTLAVSTLESQINPGISVTNDGHDKYIEAAVDGATVNVDFNLDKSEIDDPLAGESFYYYNRFIAQNSILNVGANINAELASTTTATAVGADRYKNQVIALEMNASIKSTIVTDTQININNGVTIVAARKDNGGTGGLGAFINYGTLKNEGTIEIQKNYTSTSNGTGIYGTNGAQITNDTLGEIEIYGEEGIGIYATSWRETASDYAVKEFGTQTDQGTTNIVNNGKITTNGNNSVGIYLENNSNKPTIPDPKILSVSNTGTIKVANDSTAIYAEGNGTVTETLISNTGILDVGTNSTGIYGINNVTISNIGNLVLSADSIGIALNPTSLLTASFGTITDNAPTGEKILLAINGAATGATQITSLAIPTSALNLSTINNMTALYVQGATGATNNSTNLELGSNSVGVYVKNGDASNVGLITLGTGKTKAVGMFTKDGTIINNATGSISLSDNTQFGMVAMNATGFAINNGAISLNASGTTGVLVKDGATITDNAAGSIAFNSTKSFAIASDNANILLNGGTVQLANSGENIYVYSKNNSIVTVMANLEIDGIAAALPQRSVGIYLDGINTLNNGFEIKATDGVVGVYANGASTLTGGSYTSEEDKTVGIYLANGGILANTTINAKSTGTDMAIGAYLAQGIVNISTGLIINLGDVGYATGTGMYLSEGASVSGDKITIENKSTTSNIGLYYMGTTGKIGTQNADMDMIGNSQLVGVYVDGGMQVINNNAITDLTTTGAVGALVGGNSTYVANGMFTGSGAGNSVGYMAENGTAENKGTIIMTGGGATSAAMIAKSSGGIAIVKNSGTIMADDASGIVVIGGSGISTGENTDQINVTTGVGVYVENTNANFINSGTITVVGNGAAIALNATGANQVSNTGTLNLGVGSLGVYGENNSLMDFNLAITGTGATGVFANTGTIVSGNIDAGNSVDTLAAYLSDSTSTVNGSIITTGTYGGGTSTSVGLYLGGIAQTHTLSNITVNANSTNTIGIYPETGNQLNYAAGATTNVGSGAIGIYLTGIGSILETQGGTLNIDGSGIGIVASSGALADIGTLGSINVNFTGTGGVLSFNDGGTINLGTQINILSGSGTLAATRNGNLSNSGTVTIGSGSVGLLGSYSAGGPYTIENTTTGIINVQNGGVGLAATGTGATVIVKNDGQINVDGTSSVGMYSDLGPVDNSLGTINVTNKGIGIYITGTGTIANLGTINSTGGIGYVVDGITLGVAPTGNIILNTGTSTNYSIGGYYKNVSGTIILPALTQSDYSIAVAVDGGTNSIGTVSTGTSTGKNQIGVYTNNSNTTITTVAVNGDENIGLYSENSNITISSLLVGHTTPSSASSNMSKSSVGAYISNGSMSVTALDVKDNGIGIFGDKSNVTLDTLQVGEKGLGVYISGTGAETITVSTSANIGKGSLGINGKNANISMTGPMNIAEGTAVGILSEGTGNVTYNGVTTIADKGTSTASIGIYKGTGRIIQKDSNGDIVVDGNGDEIELSAGIYTEGIITTSGIANVGDNGYGVYIDNRATSFSTGTVTLNNGSNINLSEASVGIFAGGSVVGINSGSITVGSTYLGPNNDHADVDNHLNSVGIYLTQGSQMTNSTSGTINVLHDHSLGVYTRGIGTSFTNDGILNIDNGGVGILAVEYATIANNGTINTGYNSNGSCGQSNVGVGVYSGAIFTNNTSGIINVGDGVGVYIGNTSSFINNGTINIDDGTGVSGDGTLVNNGIIAVKDLNGDGLSDGVDKNSSKPDPINHGAITITNNGKVIVNNQYIHSGSFIADHVVSNGAVVNIANPSGDYMFNVNTIEGSITLDSNFIKEGNGYGWTVDNFLNVALLSTTGTRDLTITTSPLFVAEVTSSGGLAVAKQPYAYLVTGSQFDNLYNGLDSLLAQDQEGNTVASTLLKELNAYLDNIYKTQGQSAFEAEAARTLAETRGDIYSTIQQRLNHIQGTFDNSFEELVSSHNFTKDTGKYSVIYQQGTYRDDTVGIDKYDYRVQGLMYMNETESRNYGNKWGYSLGFAVSRFDFDDAPTYGDKSKEDIYSLRAGLHNVHAFDEDDTWNLRTRLEVGYNRHITERTIELDKTYKNKGKYSSYNVTFDNRLSKTLYRDVSTELKLYADLNMEYSYIASFTEKAKGDSALELKLKSRDSYSIEGALGVQASKRAYIGKKFSIKLTGDLSYGHDFGNTYDKRVKAKVDGGTEGYYSLIRPKEEKGHVKGKVGVTIEKRDHYGVTFEVEARKHEKKKKPDVTFGVRFKHVF